MKNIKTITTMVIVAIALNLSSCLKPGKAEGLEVTQTYPGYFNEIINENTGEITYYKGVGYTAVLDYTDGTCDLKVEGLQTPDGKYPTLLFENVPWKFNSKGWQEISVRDYQPEGVGSFTQAPHFDYMLFQSANRYITGQYVPLVKISYKIDNKYLIFSLPTEFVEIGQSTITNKADGSEYKPDPSEINSMYVFLLDIEKKTARITLAGMKFHKDMPAMNIRFNDVPFEATIDGHIKFYKNELIPCQLTGASLSSATETPIPNITISGLNITYDPARGLWMSYTCSINMPKFTGEYDVTTINQYPDQIEYE